MLSPKIFLHVLTLSNMAQGRFTLAHMSHDHLHGSHTGLPTIERVKIALLPPLHHKDSIDTFGSQIRAKLRD